MDLSCIISSGDLELYVLGMLSSDDAYKIEQLAQLFPEIKAELDEIEDALINTANTSEVAPSVAVKENLFSKLKALQPVAGTDTTLNREEATLAKVVPLNRPKPRSSIMAAAVIAALIAVGAIAYAFITNSQNRAQIAAVKTKADSLQSFTAIQQQRLSAYSQSIKLYQDTAFQKINLSSVPGKPNALVQLFWNRRTNAVYVANISLPQAPAGKQYQLWAIVKGKPVSAGLLTNNKQLAEAMNPFADADAFAITLEKEGGSPTPSLPDMLYVIGKTS